MAIEELDTMARPKTVTALHDWMHQNWLGDSDVAVKLNALPEMSSRRPVNARQIARWRKGLAVPRPYYALALETLTEGRVTGRDFMQAKVLTDEEDKKDD